MGKPTKALISTAYHEAGHVVAAYIECIKLKKATIIPSEDYLGVVVRQRMEKRIRDAFEFGEITPAKRARLESFIMMSYAGGIAQQKHRGRANHIGSSSDYDNVVDLAMMATGSVEETEAYLKWLYVRTKQVVNVYWYLIEAIAEALLEHQTLSAADIERIMSTTKRPH
jgi:ATP-dependent Zn protease